MLAAADACPPSGGVADPGLDRLAAAIARFVGAPAAVISLLAGDDELLPGAFGLPEPWGTARRLPPSHSLTVHVIRNGGPLVTDDARNVPSLEASAAIGDLRIVAFAGAPLTTSGGQVVGLVAVIDAAPRAWSTTELEWLDTGAALATANIELFRRLQAAEVAERTVGAEMDAIEQENATIQSTVRGLEVLLDLSHRLAGEPDARRGVCQAATELGDASAALLWEPGAAGNELVLTAEHNADLAPLSVPLGAGASAEADTLLEAERRVVSAFGREAAIHGSRVALPSHGEATFALEPVIGEEGPIGVLEVVWQRAPADVPPTAATLIGLLAIDAAAAITRAQRTARLVAEARTDPLTGLPNRRAWDEQLPRELAHAKRLDYPACLAIADLDRFKEVNDRRGHAAGDQLLCALAANWRAELRETDLLARIGGDEFALLLPGTTAADAAEIAGRLRRTAPKAISASIGVAEWDRRETTTDFLARADRALYAAKHERDRTVLAPPGTVLGDT